MPEPAQIGLEESIMAQGFSRRDFLMTTAAGAAATAQASVSSAAATTPRADVVWLDGAAPPSHEGQTFGVPWPRGARRSRTTFSLRDTEGRAVPVQSWPLAFWPDGSLKWTAHAVAAGAANSAGVNVHAGRPASPREPVSVRESAELVEVVSGHRRWRVPRSGGAIIAESRVGDRLTLKNVRLVALTQDGPDAEEGAAPARARFESAVERVTVEQTGPVRAVLKVEGRHRSGDRAWLPFSLRLYFYAGSMGVRIVHSFIFDGDENRDFIRGLGLTADVPMTDLPHDRHLRFAGEGDGLWGEAVRTLTGLRREPPPAFREAQVAGKRTPPVEQIPVAVRGGLHLIPEWGDFTLSQPNADGFTLRKRTKAGHGWIDIVGGRRANGLGYVGGAAGGVAFAMADFWRRPPTRLDVRDAHTDTASLTVWLWSPDAPAMDIRFYHDGMGMKDHAAEIEGLNITYEDYEEGWGRPYGIARTNELWLWALDETPSHDRLSEMARQVTEPPRLVAAPARIHAAQVLGDWTLVDRSSPTRRRIEDQNEYLLDFYMGQVEQRRWYGFWHHGDVMHSYDSDRHVWKYDVGGYAWANSELSPDLWLWYSFLRSGRPDVFRLAEAMTRHTGEVDVCHIGRFKGLGTRHGVQHWSDSSKQPRVSNAAYRRIYYYLTGDERVGDLMRDLVASDHTLEQVDINRKVRRPGDPPPTPGVVDMGFGTTWSSLAAAWLTEWERTGDRRWRDRLVAGMDSIASLKKQWFAGGAPYDLKTGRFQGPGERVSISHLNAVFGAAETHSELFQLIDHPAYREAWLDYCAFYNAPDAEFTAKTGAPSRARSLKEGHSRLTAYAAAHRGDPRLAERAWFEFLAAEAGMGLNMRSRHTRLAGPTVIAPVDENLRVSTNGASQWGLAAIQNLALVGDSLEAAAAKAPPEPEKRERPGTS
jgi:hypothetical protein